MKHIYTLFFLLGSVTATLAQTRYYHFTGTIQGDPASFHLCRNNEHFNGYYYLLKDEEAIDCSGELNKNQFLILMHTGRNWPKAAMMVGKFKDSAISGKITYESIIKLVRVAGKKDSTGLTFDYIRTNSESKLPWQQADSTRLPYTAGTVWPAATCTHPATSLIKQLIAGEFDEHNGGDRGKVILKRVQVAYASEKLLTLASHSYVNGGGTQLNHYTNYICIDLLNNRKLSLTDVIDTAGYQAKVQTILEQKFRSAFTVEDKAKLSDYLFVDPIPISANFSVTSKGIGFHYNPSDIAPNSLGDAYFYIPFSEYSTYLKPEFMHFLGWGK